MGAYMETEIEVIISRGVQYSRELRDTANSRREYSRNLGRHPGVSEHRHYVSAAHSWPAVGARPPRKKERASCG